MSPLCTDCLQAPVMIKYPASLSVTAYSYFFATTFMVLTGVIATSGLHEWALTKAEVIAVLYAVSDYSPSIYICLIILHHLHSSDAKTISPLHCMHISIYLSICLSGNCRILSELLDHDMGEQSSWTFSGRPLQSTATSLFHRPLNCFPWRPSLPRKVWFRTLPNDDY
jgi:hypothetical protein